MNVSETEMNERDDTDRPAPSRASDREQIDCEEALRRLAAYLDHELDAYEADEVEVHLEACRSCFSRAEFERRLKERIRRDLEVHDVPAALEKRVRSILRSLPEGS